MTEKLVESLGILHEEKRKFWVNPLHPLKQSVRFRGRSKESGGREGGGGGGGGQRGAIAPLLIFVRDLNHYAVCVIIVDLKFLT